MSMVDLVLVLLYHFIGALTLLLATQEDSRMPYLQHSIEGYSLVCFWYFWYCFLRVK